MQQPTIEEIKQELKEVFDPQKKLFQEMLSEVYGKVMDYETCRLFETFLKEYTKQMVDNLVQFYKAGRKANANKTL